MTTFRNSLWDDSEPEYAPGLQWIHNRYPRWKAPAKYVKAGYSVTGMKLDGLKGDGNDTARAQRCRQLTRDMLRWWQGEDRTAPDPDTWAALIARYKGDPLSPINDGSIKANTRAGYLEQTERVNLVWGEVALAATTYELAKTTKMAMERKGRSADFIKRHFETMRRIARFGKALRIPGARDVIEVLEEVKTSTPAPRAVAPTRGQVYAIIAEADARGLSGFAAGIALQYELSLRAVDVRGHWLPVAQGAGGIERDGRGTRWQDGLTWDMFDRDLSRFTKVISKTRKSMPEPYQFDLTALPEIRSRLRLLRGQDATGPVIVSSTGMPYDQRAWTRTWARIRDSLGLPQEIQCMDLRAGGLTEAESLGARPTQLRNAGQHRHIKTTSGYLRQRSADANKVVSLRQNAR